MWPGIPAVPGRERRGRGKAAPSGPWAAGPARLWAFGSPLPRGSPERLATLVHSSGQARFLGLASAEVASKEEEEAGRGAQHANLGTCSWPASAAAPAQARDAWSSAGRQRLPPAAVLPGGGPRQTPQSLGGGAERGHPLPERTAANQAEIGDWLVTGAPAVARAAVPSAGSTLSARSRASGAAEESIIQVSAAASSSPSASREQRSPRRHSRADTHTPAQGVCSAPPPVPTPLVSGSQKPRGNDPYVPVPPGFLSCT